MKPIIFDTGPLVAWLCPRDLHHQWARHVFSGIKARGIICEAVIAEVSHLAAKEGIPGGRVVDLVIDGGFHLTSLSTEMLEIRDLLNTYADIPMDFADACVTRLAELYEGSTVCTIDTDFLVYRKNRMQMIPLLAPFSE